jgi:hypothetical protein
MIWSLRLVGTSAATFAQGHHRNVYTASKYCVHGKCYVAANRPLVVTQYSQPRRNVGYRQYYYKPVRAVYLHRSYGPIYYSADHRHYYRRDAVGNAIVIGATLGAIGFDALIAANN